ncbi:DUF4184 family protein [Pontibacter diazotrophicus]|uniref:DUF4184 family protein n=1 Tax=Pontibacter diazotrophicus TaxID=1400979 RepID=A0A3D8L138_9BACT|nr:DUF4184 family protein [Pontibacter diazotrophicus]RDV11086.1 DUF4184 family protein [Pontibacter diazotrophicus]
MPFTFSHPAAVLPFRYLPKGWSSLTGLVIGSMAPDFEKFFNMQGGNSYSHTWGAIFWFCLPLGIVLSFLFHLVVRDPLIDNLPAFMRKRLARFKELDWVVHFKKHYLLIIVSIVVGAVTHLIWDGFTHKNGPGQNQFTLLPASGGPSVLSMPLFYVLNILSSVVGLAIVLYAILRLPPKDIPADKENRTIAYWPVVMLIILVIVVVRIVFGLNLNEVLRMEGDFWDFVITTVAAIFISLLIAPIILRLVSFNR